MAKYNINKMLIDGFSKEQIADEISKSEKINIAKIYQDGYSADDILSAFDDKYNPNIVQEAESFKTNIKQNLDTIKSELKKGEAYAVLNPIKAITGNLNFNPNTVRQSLQTIKDTSPLLSENGSS